MMSDVKAAIADAFAVAGALKAKTDDLIAMTDEKHKPAFVPVRSLARGGAPDPAEALAEIRRIYFKTSQKTIEHDFAHAIELLKSLPDEQTREKAHVYMEGLAEMRKEWSPKAARRKSKR